MEAANLLCNSLFRWLENRKECAEKLKELAEAATYVLSEPGVVTGGMVPKLATTTADAAVGDTSPLVEEVISSSTFNKAIELSKEDEEVGTSIQKHLQDLKDRCGGTQLGDHADELDCEVTSLLMCALARRKKTLLPLDFLRDFNRATVFRHLTPGGLDPDEAKSFICRALDLDPVPVIKSSLKILDAIGLDRSLNNLIVTCEELVKGKLYLDVNKFLRDSAREIQEGEQQLQEQLDAMHEIIQKLFRLKNLIKDLGGYSLSMNEDGQKIIDYIIGTCRDSTVVSWLRELTHQIEFVNLLRFVMGNFGPIIEDLTRPDGGHKDIVIVAHGRILDQFMPAGGLVPTPNIIDTILYSPWNCGIDAYAALGIAHGNIDVTNRGFHDMAHMIYCEPDLFPDHWNSMRESLHDIPMILLSPLTPEDRAWTLFRSLLNDRDLFTEDRVIIPYLVPQDLVNAYGEIPLFIIIFVTSFILGYYDKTATVHLAACLVHAGSPVEWRRQYGYTSSDKACMTMYMNASNMNTVLLDAFRSMFDRNCR